MATLNTIFAKKIPTILGLVFLVAGLGVAVYMVGGSTSSFFPRASPETAPRNIKVTNVSANQFTISFVTDTETSAFVRYGSSANQITSRAADDRELTSGVPQRSTTHHITAKGLNPSTTYYFLIGTGTNTMYNDAGQPYQVTTGPNLGSTPQAVTLSGKVETESGTSAEDSLVYVTAQNGAALSSWVRRTGFFAIPLSNARTTDFKAYLNPGENTPTSIFVQGFNGQTASSTINLPKDGNIAESIVLGVSGESQRAAPVLDEDGMPGMPSDSGAPGESAFTNAQLNPAVEVPGAEQSSSTESGDLTITTIPADGTVLTETKPTIEGIAPPNTQLQIKINSTPSYNLSANTDANGNFTITPPGNLSPGQHTLTISYVDANGATQTTRRTFLVQANGTATGTGARGTTSTPSYTSSPSGTTRNGTSTATGTATPRPTATPRTVATATGTAVPVAGTPAQTAFILIAGLFMVYGGIFLSKKLVQESATEIPDNP